MVEKVKHTKRLTIKHIVDHKLHGILVLFFIILGVWLRYIDMAPSMWFLTGYDEPRDMLVARHIVEFGEWIWRGPFAAGSGNRLMNSPVYYWMLAVLWAVSRSPFGFSFLWVVITSVSMWLAYKIGSVLWDKTTGVFALALAAVHPELVYDSLHISQPHMLVVSTFFFLWIMVSTTKWRISRLVLAVIAACMPLHFHYGSLMLLPASLAWIGYVSVQEYQNHRDIRWIAVPVAVAEGMILLWLYLSYTVVPFDQFFYIKHAVSGAPDAASFSYIVSLALHNILWSSDYKAALLGTGVASIVALWQASRRSARFRVLTWWLFTYATVPLFIASIQNVPVRATYFLGTLPAFLLLIVLGLRTMWKGNRPVTGTVFFLILLFFLRQNQNEHIALRLYGDIYQQYRSIASAVVSDNASLDAQADVRAAAVVMGEYLPYDGWSGAFWFALEEKTGMQLVSLTNYGANFTPIDEPSARFMYLVCDNRMGLSTKGCVSLFRSVRPYVLPGETEVYARGEFTVYRVSLDSRIAVSSHNEYYPPEILSQYK